MELKKLLGIPIPIVIVGLIFVLAAGGAIAAFLWNASIPSTVTVIGSEVQAYSNEACTDTLTAIDFGDVRASQDSGGVSIWVKNLGDDPVYVAIAQDGLISDLTLYAGDSAVPADPGRLALSTTEASWVDAGVSPGSLSVNTQSDSPTVRVGFATDFPSAGYIEIGDVVISYTTKTLVLNTTYDLGGCTLIEGGVVTLPAASVVTVVTPVPGDDGEMAPDAVIEVVLHIAADASVTRGINPFETIIEAQDIPYYPY